MEPDEADDVLYFTQKELSPMLTGDINPLASIESPEFRAKMKDADLIFGFDISREQDVLMYGRLTLKAARESGKTLPFRVLRIKYDQRTGDQLEILLAAIQVVKGRHDYQEGTE